MPGEPEPDYAQDIPYTAAARPGFAMEHPDDVRMAFRPALREQGPIHATPLVDDVIRLLAAPSWFVYGDEYEIPYWFLVLLFALAPATRSHPRAAVASPRALPDLRLRPAPPRRTMPECGVTRCGGSFAVASGREIHNQQFQ